MDVFHPAVYRRGGAALPGVGIEQVQLEITRLAPVGEECDLPAVGRELGRPVGVRAEREYPGVASCELRKADTGRRLVSGIDQGGGEDRAVAMRRDLRCIGDEPAAGPAERTVQGLGFPIERGITNISLHEFSP